MHKLLGRMTFMITFYWLGLAFALSANAESSEQFSDTQARAIECTAAIEVMSRSAPQWADQSDIIEARNHWDEQALVFGAQDSKRVDAQITREISHLLEAFSNSPSEFARLAVECTSQEAFARVSG